MWEFDRGPPPNPGRKSASTLADTRDYGALRRIAKATVHRFGNELDPLNHMNGAVLMSPRAPAHVVGGQHFGKNACLARLTTAARTRMPSCGGSAISYVAAGWGQRTT